MVTHRSLEFGRSHRVATGEIWHRIERYEGQVFRQKRGKEFTYWCQATMVYPST
jgi:hypothetical protein